MGTHCDVRGDRNSRATVATSDSSNVIVAGDVLDIVTVSDRTTGGLLPPPPPAPPIAATMAVEAPPHPSNVNIATERTAKRTHDPIDDWFIDAPNSLDSGPTTGQRRAIIGDLTPRLKARYRVAISCSAWRRA